jgi:NitT/TauT family transport system ATP-binding protein
MFQTPELFPWRSAIDNVLLPIDAQGLKRKAHIGRARALLDLVGLADSEHAYPRELSGGMQQRVALSRTLMADPAILLMDEPFGSLDEFTRERLDLELEAIWERHKKTVLFVTHSIPEAVLLSERVLVFGSSPGRIIADHRIDLPRPRTVQLMRTSRFVDATFAIRESMGIA